MTVREYRKQTGLSQRKFARQTGIPLGTLLHWEQGHSKPPKYVEPLLDKALRYDKLIK